MNLKIGQQKFPQIQRKQKKGKTNKQQQKQANKDKAKSPHYPGAVTHYKKD